MKQDDPEKRIADLEYQLAERRGHAELTPASPGHTAAPRSFVASPPFWGSKWNAKRGMYYMYAGMALFFLPMLFLSLSAAQYPRIYAVASKLGYPLVFTLGMLVLLGGTIQYWRHSRRRILVSVTSDGLTVSQRPGDVFSFSDAQLGPWSYGMSMGSALHLRCGPHRFVLGGRDHRVTSGTRVEAAPTVNVDAWLRAADFAELLAIAGRGQGFEGPGPAPGQPDARGTAPGEQVRCLLFPNPEFMSVQPLFKPWRVTRMAKDLMNSPPQPSVAIDVGADTISVIEPNTNALKASAPVAQVTWAREIYILLRPYPFAWPLRFFPYWYLKAFQWTTPVLVLGFPGLEPLSIGCRDVTFDPLFVVTDTIRNRFSWHDKVPKRINRPADYAVSAADWLTLLEKFGLVPYLEQDPYGSLG